tara:strand:+ start:24604 stop:25611 length:1008 start_codon:yes stop_codon:yes gene_type:complete
VTKTYDICGIGNALVDQQYKIPFEILETLGLTHGQMTLATLDEQNTLLDFLADKQFPFISSCGGSATNSLVASSSFGSSCIQLYRVASDNTGSTYRNNLTEFGVDSHHSAPHNHDDLPTGSCVVLVTPDSQRTMSTYLGISAHMTEPFISKSVIANSKIMYLEGYMVTNPDNLKTTLLASHYAKQAQTKRALSLSDPGIVTHFYDAFVQLCSPKMDLIFCNEAEALAFTKTHSLVEAETSLLTYTDAFVITRGEHGAVIYDGSQKHVVTGKSVKAIDTNGAGDIFAGAFLSALLQQDSYYDAGIFANEAAALLVQQFGPRLSKDHYQNLISFMPG